MSKPHYRPVRLKGAAKANPGQVTGSYAVTKKEQDGSTTTLHEGHSSAAIVQPGEAMAGVGMGLTIPGPAGTYTAARVDAYCYLPCQPTNEGVREAMAQASELVQQQIESDAKEVQRFFVSMKGR